MLGRIGVCCLVLWLAASSASQLADVEGGGAAGGAPATLAEASGRLLRMHEIASRPPGRGLLSPAVVEILPELARFEGPAGPDDARWRLRTSLLLSELARLAGRVSELESELLALRGRPPSAPLVRITVARNE